MIEENQQWHYTDSNGQQAGPVTTRELRSLVDGGKASEESMVWSEGMENWTLASQIDGLIPTKIPVPTPAAIDPTPPSTAAPSPTATAAANPYAPPTAVETANPGFGGAFHNEIEYGGIRRLNYFVRILLLFVLLIVCAVFAGAMAGGGGAEPTLILALIGILAFLIFYIRFALLRIRNMGASGWWLLLMLVPIASNVLAIALLSCPEGFAHHKKMDTGGIVVACILGGLTLLSFIGNLAAVFG